MKIDSTFLIGAAMWLLSCAAIDAQDNQLQLFLRDGSRIAVNVPTPDFEWWDIAPDGSTPDGSSNSRQVQWSQIRELNLIESPVAEQIDSIHALLDELASPEYSKREAAEEKLKDAELLGLFKSVIQDRVATLVDNETVYRIHRILSEYSDYADTHQARFDHFVDNNGVYHKGNAGKLQIDSVSFNTSVKFDRKQLLRISPISDASILNTRSEPVSVKTFNTPGTDFYETTADDVFISFEADVDSRNVPIGKQVNELYQSNGLLMTTEFAGFIQVIKYPFKFCPIDAGERCVCPYDGASKKRLRGSTIISFCVPGQPNVVAGVRNFGLFLERIEHSRDFVVEAYNARDQMIGRVEASDQICVFAGFKSNELIAKIRVAQNADLPELERDVDQTYAIDCVTFDTPGEITSLARATNQQPTNAKVNLTSGDSFFVQQLDLTTDSINFENPVNHQNSEYAWEQIDSIAMIQPRASRNINRRQPMVQLADGSIVKTESKSPLTAYDFVGHEFERSQAVGIWSGTARMAFDTDFESRKPVIVFPSCRIIADNFRLDASHIHWNSDTSKKLIENVLLGDKNDDGFKQVETADPDLTPQIDNVDFSSSETIPSVWFSPPQTLDSNRGHVQLNDGQLFVLEGGIGFELKQIDNKRKLIVISLDGKTKSYPLNRLVSITLPKAATGK